MKESIRKLVECARTAPESFWGNLTATTLEGLGRISYPVALTCTAVAVIYLENRYVTFLVGLLTGVFVCLRAALALARRAISISEKDTQ